MQILIGLCVNLGILAGTRNVRVLSKGTTKQFRISSAKDFITLY